MSDDALPEPDRIPGAPHPREADRVFGHDAEAAEFLAGHASGRLHHGWLLTGPRGVGKATLAWAMARFLLATPQADDDGLFGAPPAPDTLHVAPDHPVARRVRALSDPGVFLLRRGGAGTSERDREKAVQEGRFSDMIRVDEVRKLRGYLALSATDGGRRVVIVDDADALNTQAANAILKMLEEPPARTTMLLISHQPAGLLPTIRSRCRTLRLSPLGADDMARALDQAGAEIAPGDAPAFAELSAGSVGAAMRLAALDGLTLYRELVTVLAGAPAPDRAHLMALADSCAGRGREERLDLVLTLLDLLAARIARTGVTGVGPALDLAPDEGVVLRRLAPDPAAARRWAQAVAETGARARHARAVNVDAAALVTDLLLGLSRAA
ncbi:DNA polymerase III subunit delta' [Citreimonas sp.]|uniref:DNA polymerase III subunit delta' n=1 Tax=Citreimonas sp. TaxID=3036715 RepID=UPI004059156B